MTLNEYQDAAGSTDTYKNDTLGISARFMGVSGESGEATDKAKKEIRDYPDDAFKNPERNKKIAYELGDAFWYIARASAAIGYTLQEVADLNLEKLASRFMRDKIHGNGDER